MATCHVTPSHPSNQDASQGVPDPPEPVPPAASPPGPDDARRFLEALFGPDDFVLLKHVETWTEPGEDGRPPRRRSRVVYGLTLVQRCRDWPGLLPSLLGAAARSRANTFLGVCPRHGQHERGRGERRSYDHAFQIRTARVLWADLDHCTPDEAVRRCETAGLPRPSIVVASGNGTHLYWFLDTPYLIDDAPDPPPAVHIEFQGPGEKPIRYVEVDGRRETDRSRWPTVSPKGRLVERILAGVAAAIGGDHTQDLSRLLRLPGSWNRKDERIGREPVPCVLVECEAGRRYPLALFERFAVEEPAEPPAAERPHPDRERAETDMGEAGEPPPSPEPTVLRMPSERIERLLRRCLDPPHGDRSAADFALVCAAIEEGWTREELWPHARRVGKSRDRGWDYFELTWRNASRRVQAGPRPAVPAVAESTHEDVCEDVDEEDGYLEAQRRGRERAERWAEALAGGGIALDPTPFPLELIAPACHEAVLTMGLGRTLIVCQSSDDCSDMHFEFLSVSGAAIDRDRFLPAVMYPERTRFDPRTGLGTCRNFDEVRRAQSLGLPPSAAVCSTCEYRQGCRYLSDLERASQAPHAIMTTGRAAGSNLVEAAAQREAVLILNGRALDVLTPTIECHVRPDVARESVQRIAEAAHDAGGRAGRRERDAACEYFAAVAGVAETLLTAVDAGSGPVDLPTGTAEPRGWAASLKATFDEREWTVDRNLVRICTAAAAGRVSSLVVHSGPAGSSVVARLCPRIPDGRLLALDPTLTPECLEAVAGRPVHTARTELAPFRAVQVPERVTAKKTPGAVAKTIRGYLERHTRGAVGVVLPAKLHGPVAEELSARERQRVRLCGWGADLRALSDCVLTVVLGHPPVPPRAVIERLLQTGHAEAAAACGRWGELPWLAELPWGQAREVPRRGYHHPDWQRAYEQLVSGRLRAILANLSGPAVVHCAEELGLALEEAPPALDDLDGEILSVLRSLPAISTTREENSLVVDMAGRGIHVILSQLRRITGAPERTLRRHLSRLSALGLVARCGVRGGWLLAGDR
jgi:DNA-binding transcriptional ArsR family regulator